MSRCFRFPAIECRRRNRRNRRHTGDSTTKRFCGLIDTALAEAIETKVSIKGRYIGTKRSVMESVALSVLITRASTHGYVGVTIINLRVACSVTTVDSSYET